MSIVYDSDPRRGLIWQAWLAEHAPDLPFYLWPETGDPQQVSYLVTWTVPENLGERFPNLKVIFSVGAGADQFDYSRLPPGVRVVRMIEPGIAQSMTAYITFSVLALHREIPMYLRQQQKREWKKGLIAPTEACRVGIMGLGTLGQAAALQLLSLGFRCSGWSRTPKSVSGVTCWSGDDQLQPFLAESDILVCLLPLTSRTRGILNSDVFNQLPAGAGLIHAGRGQQLNHQDLLTALDSGQLSQAIVDVTDPEPLPEDSPFWTHPALWLTPHIASETQPETSVRVLLENIRCHQRGAPIEGLIDPQRGY